MPNIDKNSFLTEFFALCKDSSIKSLEQEESRHTTLMKKAENNFSYCLKLFVVINVIFGSLSKLFSIDIKFIMWFYAVSTATLVASLIYSKLALYLGSLKHVPTGNEIIEYAKENPEHFEGDLQIKRIEIDHLSQSAQSLNGLNNKVSKKVELSDNYMIATIVIIITSSVILIA